LQEGDLERVKAAVANHRQREHHQRLSVARAEWEQSLDERFSSITLRYDVAPLCEKMVLFIRVALILECRRWDLSIPQASHNYN
jgi:hypothetical protein